MSPPIERRRIPSFGYWPPTRIMASALSYRDDPICRRT